jgi:hypothetical protein
MDRKIVVVWQRLDVDRILLGGVARGRRTAPFRDGLHGFDEFFRGGSYTRPYTDLFRAGLILFLTAIGMVS